LARHGYIARGGQMIDASIVQAPRQSLSKEEKAIINEGAMPADWQPAKRRQKDMDARWTKKHGKSYFGYKVSVNADKRYKLVRKIKVSTASEHDTTHFEDVLDPANTNRDILADKGYVDGEREARLSNQGWRMHIQRKGSKGSKGKPISAASSGAIIASPKRVHASSTCSRAWHRWAARRCAPLAWQAQGCT
jgi:IS5 family transposase